MNDETAVRVLLTRSGITPTTEWDMAALVAAYTVLRPAADLLYTVPEARYESPATRFDPAPTFADWD
jgi:hypothetical protein